MKHKWKGNVINKLMRMEMKKMNIVCNRNGNYFTGIERNENKKTPIAISLSSGHEV